MEQCTGWWGDLVGSSWSSLGGPFLKGASRHRAGACFRSFGLAARPHLRLHGSQAARFLGEELRVGSFFLGAAATQDRGHDYARICACRALACWGFGLLVYPDLGGCPRVWSEMFLIPWRRPKIDDLGDTLQAALWAFFWGGGGGGHPYSKQSAVQYLGQA